MVEFLNRIIGPLRSPERLDDTFEARVMSAIHLAAREEQHVAGRRAMRRSWWLRGRTVNVSPLGALAMAAGVAVCAALGFGGAQLMLGRMARPDAQARTASVATPLAAAVDTVHVVRFVLLDPEAQSVSLVGDFNAWAKDATPLMEESEDGAWTVSLPLAAGRHEYAFVVRRADGEHFVADPFANAVRDDFGTVSSVVTVGARDSRAARGSS